VPLIVLACALSVAARYMPRTRERAKAALAASLGGAQARGWRARLVARLAPQAPAAGCASGCDSGGCNSCDSNTSGNASSPAPAAQEKPIRIVRKPQGKG
jgi:hypothetical protein